MIDFTFETPLSFLAVNIRFVNMRLSSTRRLKKRMCNLFQFIKAVLA